LATRDGRVAEDRLFAAEQSARLVRNAERYYRSLIRGDVSSWNVRDQHMAETLDALAEHLSRAGRPARIVVWAHNSHLGDPRATDFARRGELNLGQFGTRALAGRDAGRRLQHRPRHRLGRLRLGCAGRAEARAAGPRRKLRAALPHDRDPGLPDRPAGDRRARAAAITAEWEQGELPETYPSAL
ncbi:MAG TPA: erythromycin esterase family protein, partial [Gaiellaceae bacterium]